MAHKSVNYSTEISQWVQKVVTIATKIWLSCTRSIEYSSQNVSAMNDTALQKQNGSFDPGGVTSAAASLQNNVLTK